MINGDDRKAKGCIAEVEEWYSGKSKSAKESTGDKRLKQLITQRKKLQSKPPKKPRNANNPTAALQYQAAQKNHRQALQRLNQAISKLGGNATNGRLAKRPLTAQELDKLINMTFLRTLSRMPSASELGMARADIGSSPDKIRAVRDLLWALLNTKEFLVNH